MYQLGLVEPVDCLGQRVVVAVALAAHRGLDARLGQAFAVPDADVLRASIRVMDQAAALIGLARVQRLLQRIEHEVRSHRTAYAPAHNAPGEDVDDEGHVQPALPGRDVGKVRDPQLIGPIRLELPINPVQRARCFVVADGGSHDLAAHHPAQPQTPHQPLDSAAGHSLSRAPASAVA